MINTLGSIFNVLVSIGIPLAALIYCARKGQRLVVPFLVGAATMLVSQFLLRIPILQALGTQAWYGAFAGQYPALYSILIGLSAGVFEEVARYVAMKLLKRHRGHVPAVAMGLGHGGFEAAILVGLNNIVLLVAMQDILQAEPALNVWAAGAERIFAMAAHVGFSVMVMRAVERRQPLWLVLAILLHGVLDGALGILQGLGVGILGIEIYIAAFGLCMLAFTFFSRPKAAPSPAPQEATHEENT